MFIGYIGTDSIVCLSNVLLLKKAGVEDGRINNQRKAFDMLAWSEGIDNGRQKKPEIMVMIVIVGGELFTDYLITLANLSR